MQHSFSRTELLIGKENMENLRGSKVVVFGIGGVGSFVTEGLARCGVGKLVLVDDDTICLTNLNRQIHANRNTVGEYKTEVMKERILDINPACEVTIHKEFVNKDNIDDIVDKDVNYVVDAIDTVTSKIDIIVWCKKNNIRVISCMGTGNKLDPTQFKIGDIYKTKMCPLAKVMRHELRKLNIEGLKVLYSEEMPLTPIPDDDEKNMLLETTSGRNKRQTPGSISFVPSVAGLIISGEVIKDIIGYQR